MTVRTTKSDAFRVAVVDAAVHLFLEKGYHGTNIQNVAQSLGVTRPTVYHYFTNKESILQAIADDTTFAAQKLAAKFKIKHPSQDPIKSFCEFVSAYLNLILVNPAKFRVSEREVDNLPCESKALAKDAWRSVHLQFTALIRNGVDIGVFEVKDPKVAAFGIIGLCNWSAWWYRPEGTHNKELVIDMLTEMSLKTVQHFKNSKSNNLNIRNAFEQLATALGYSMEIK